MAISVKRLAGAIGAEIEGADLSRDVGNEPFSAILDAFHRHATRIH